MSTIGEVIALPGVIAAGEYTYHGDEYSIDYRGQLDPERARVAATMCRAMTMAIRRQADLYDSIRSRGPGLGKAWAWMVRGKDYTVCTIANTFCFLENDSPSLNEAIALLREGAEQEPADLVY